MSGIGIFSPPLMITRTDDRSRCSMSGSAMIALTMAGASHTVVHPRPLELVDHRGGVEGPVDDRRRPRRDQRGGREVERADVVERPAGQAEVGAGEAELDDVGQVLPGQVGVGEHHALGPPGGARRVHQPVDVVGRPRARRRRRPGRVARSSASDVHPSGGRVRDAAPARACASMPAVASSASSTSDSSHTRARGLGVLEDVAHLGCGEPPVDRHGDGAEVVGGEDRLEELGAVVREQAHDVAAADAPRRAGRRPAPRPARPSRRR